MYAAVGAHSHRAARRFDCEHSLVAVNVRTEASCDRQLRIHAAFRTDEPGGRLVVGGFVAVERELREAAGDVRGAEELVRDAVPVRAGDRAREELVAMVTRRPAGGLDDQTAALGKQILTRFGFELSPDGVRALHERGVRLTLADGLAGDPCVPVGRPEDMGR
jgi:predicted oxidoreductase